MFDFFKILSFLKKNLKTKDWFIVPGLILLFLLTRAINLDKFPIFTDEGIYIHWAKVAWHDASWRFISLTDGRQPLQTWATIPFLKLFPNNPLLAGRIFSMAFGFLGMSGIFGLLYYLWGKQAAFLGALFYILTPYFLFYDRMALVDGAVNAGFIWIFFLIILLAQNINFGIALTLGLVAGISLLTKSSVKVFLGMGVFAPILFFERKKKYFIKRSVNYYILFIVAAIMAFVIYNVQRLSPFFHFVSEKNYTFLLRPSEFLKNPLQLIPHNLLIVPQYVFWEAAFVIPVLGIFGLILLLKKDLRMGLYFLLWFALPFAAIVGFGRVIFPRYLNFFASLFLVLAVYLIIKIKKRNIVIGVIALYLLSVAYFDYTIIFAQNNIPFPPIDRGQYIEGTSAGHGVGEIINYARQKSQEKPVILVAEGNFGVVGDMLEALLIPSDKITVRGYWPLDKPQLIENQNLLKNNYVFVVYSHRSVFSEDLPIRLIKKYAKPGGESAFYLFELTQN